MKYYIAFIEEGKTSCSVVFPDVPGCYSAGKNSEEAIRNAEEALAFHIDELKASGDRIPNPRTLNEIKKKWADYKDWVEDGDFTVAQIPLLPTEHKTERVQITINNILLSRIDRVAKNRSAFIEEAARRYLGMNRVKTAQAKCVAKKASQKIATKKKTLKA